MKIYKIDKIPLSELLLVEINLFKYDYRYDIRYRYDYRYDVRYRYDYRVEYDLYFYTHRIGDTIVSIRVYCFTGKVLIASGMII